MFAPLLHCPSAPLLLYQGYPQFGCPLLKSLPGAYCLRRFDCLAVLARRDAAATGVAGAAMPGRAPPCST